MTPPEPIDVCWHHFILFTSAYTAFCSDHFRRYIHHAPFTQAVRSEMRKNGSGLSALKATIALAKECFGDLSGNWRENLLNVHASAFAEEVNSCAGSTNCQAPYR